MGYNQQPLPVVHSLAHLEHRDRELQPLSCHKCQLPCTSEQWNYRIHDTTNPPEYAVHSKNATLHAVDLTPGQFPPRVTRASERSMTLTDTGHADDLWNQNTSRGRTRGTPIYIMCEAGPNTEFCWIFHDFCRLDSDLFGDGDESVYWAQVC
jgi:hypothetical protein